MKTETAMDWLYDQLTTTWHDKEAGRELLEQAKKRANEEYADRASTFYAKEMGRVFNVLQDVIGLNDRHITIILEHLNYEHETDE